MYVLWGILFFTFPLVEEVAHPEVLYGFWVLLLYLVMSGHYVLIQGAVGKMYGSMCLATIYATVFLATVSSLSFRVP